LNNKAEDGYKALLVYCPNRNFNQLNQILKHSETYVHQIALKTVELYITLAEEKNLNMQKIIITLSYFCFLCSIVSAQSTSRYPIDSTSVWRIDYIRSGVSNENTHLNGDEIYKYFIDGDTTIGSNKYFKIFKTGTAYYNEPFYFEHVYVGALRDTDNKFFYVKKDEPNEKILFDFDVKVGDTHNYENYSDVARAIRFLPDGRRIIDYDEDDYSLTYFRCRTPIIIEGIGTSGGLFESPPCGHYWDHDHYLVCYVQNGMLVYHNNEFEQNCEIINFQDNKSLNANGNWLINKTFNKNSTLYNEKLKYFFNGDTIINSTSYLKLYKSSYLYYTTNGQQLSEYNTSLYVGAIREASKKIFYVEKNLNQEILLYNFNLHIGDTIDGLIHQGDTITGIDTILNNKIIFYLADPFDNYYNYCIVEGIGSERGFIENVTDNSALICYSENNAPLCHYIDNGEQCIFSPSKINYTQYSNYIILPKEPTIVDEIKLIANTSFLVSEDNPELPIFSDTSLFKKPSATIEFEMFYVNNQLNSKSDKIGIFVYDTFSLGHLDAGTYYFRLKVNNIFDNKGITDTVCISNEIRTITVESSYYPILSSRFPIKPTSAWRINYKEMDYDTVYDNSDEALNFFINRDTTINKIKYFKLYKSGTGYWGPPVTFEYFYLGAIREEENKIYYFERHSANEELLYDFDVKVNDTIKSYIEKGMVVTSIDTLDDGRKKINIKKTDFQLGKCNNINNTYLIEGVGSMGGLLYESPCKHIGFQEHYLLCYFENGNIAYQNTLSPLDCNGQPPLALKLVHDQSVKIYQNQIYNKLIVEFHGEISNASMLYIYDIAGRSKLTTKIQAYEHKTEIDISSLKKGIYIVKVNSDQFNITKKIMVE